MNTLAVFYQVCTLLLAALAGCSLARAGVVTGRAWGAVDVKVWRWRVVCDTLQFRNDKFYYRLAIVPGQ